MARAKQPTSVEELRTLAWAAFDAGRFSEAELLYGLCLERLGLAENPEQLKVKHMLAFTYAMAGKHEQARALYGYLLETARRLSSPEDEHVALHQIGMVERLAGNLAEAQARFQEERQIIEARLKSGSRLSANSCELGMVAAASGDSILAERLLRQACAEARLGEDPLCEPCALRELGKVYAAGDRSGEARNCLVESAAKFRASGDGKAAREADDLLRTLPQFRKQDPDFRKGRRR